MDVADLLDQLDRRAAERIDRPLDLGQSEARVRRRGADVRGEQQLDAAADAVAVDRGHDRLRVHVGLQQRVIHDLRHLGCRGQIAADVGAGAEGALAGAGQHDAAGVVALQLVPQPPELRHHLPRHGVQARLVVNGDDGDVPAMPGESDLHHSGSRQRHR